MLQWHPLKTHCSATLAAVFPPPSPQATGDNKADEALLSDICSLNWNEQGWGTGFPYGTCGVHPPEVTAPDICPNWPGSRAAGAKPVLLRFCVCPGGF